MNLWETIIILVIIGAALKMLQDRRARTDDGLDDQGSSRVSGQRNPEADHLREEVKMLKDRLAVLERIATDNNRAIDLDREIDRLR